MQLKFEFEAPETRSGAHGLKNPNPYGAMLLCSCDEMHTCNKEKKVFLGLGWGG